MERCALDIINPPPKKKFLVCITTVILVLLGEMTGAKKLSLFFHNDTTGSYQHPSSSGARTFRGGVGGCSTRFSEERLLKRSSLFGLVSAEKKTQLGNSVLRHTGSPPGKAPHA